MIIIIRDSTSYTFNHQDPFNGIKHLAIVNVQLPSHHLLQRIFWQKEARPNTKFVFLVSLKVPEFCGKLWSKFKAQLVSLLNIGAFREATEREFSLCKPFVEEKQLWAD